MAYYAVISSTIYQEASFIDYRFIADRAAKEMGFTVSRNSEVPGETQTAFDKCMENDSPVFILLLGEVLTDNVKAECEKALAAERIDLAAQQMHQIRRDDTRNAAVPFLRRVGFQHIVILVAAVYECNGIFQFRELFAEFLLLLGIIPEKAEIAADDYDIIRVRLFQHGILKA